MRAPFIITGFVLVVASVAGGEAIRMSSDISSLPQNTVETTVAQLTLHKRDQLLKFYGTQDRASLHAKLGLSGLDPSNKHAWHPFSETIRDAEKSETIKLIAAVAIGAVGRSEPRSIGVEPAWSYDGEHVLRMSIADIPANEGSRNSPITLTLWFCADTAHAAALYWLRSGDRIVTTSEAATLANACYRDLSTQGVGGEAAYDYNPDIAFSAPRKMGDPKRSQGRIGLIRNNCVVEVFASTYYRSESGDWVTGGLSADQRIKMNRILKATDVLVKERSGH